MIAAIYARQKTAAVALVVALIFTADSAHAQSGFILMLAPFVREPDFTRRIRAIEATPPGERTRASFIGLLNERAPLSEWRRFMTFDTAQACETQRLASLAATGSATFEKEKWSKEDQREISGATRVANARCIPASVIFGTTPRR